MSRLINLHGSFTITTLPPPPADTEWSSPLLEPAPLSMHRMLLQHWTPKLRNVGALLGGLHWSWGQPEWLSDEVDLAAAMSFLSLAGLLLQRRKVLGRCSPLKATGQKSHSKPRKRKHESHFCSSLLI